VSTKVPSTVSENDEISEICGTFVSAYTALRGSNEDFGVGVGEAFPLGEVREVTDGEGFRVAALSDGSVATNKKADTNIAKKVLEMRLYCPNMPKS